MPVEIRELVIRTEISSANRSRPVAASEKELAALKMQLLEECKRMILLNAKKNRYDR